MFLQITIFLTPCYFHTISLPKILFILYYLTLFLSILFQLNNIPNIDLKIIKKKKQGARKLQS